MTAWRRTSQLTAEQCAWIQAFLADHPWYEFYFKSALSALATGQDNRFYALGRAGEGLIMGIAFAGIDVFSLVGHLDEDEVRSVLERSRRAEIHADAQQAHWITSVGGRRWTQTGVGYFQLADPAPHAIDSRCRQLAPTDLEIVAAFYGQHYPDNVFSPWMLELPFVGLFERDELVAAAGTLAFEPQLSSSLIGNFLTRPDRRGRGMAATLGSSLIETLRRRGVTDIRLGVLTKNTAALHVYASLGFQKIGERMLLIDMNG
jgi:GNAT superfamily N-acetyltransferase